MDGTRSLTERVVATDTRLDDILDLVDGMLLEGHPSRQAQDIS